MHAGLPQIAEYELQQVAFALAAIAQDQDIGIGFVLVALIKIRDDIAAEFVPAQEKAAGVGFAAVVKGVQVGDGAGGQHPFKLIPEHVPPAWHDRQEALLLAEHELVDVELAADQLRQNLRLQQLELVEVMRGQLDVDRAME
ncbi:hypothetical protein SDC9_77940 [bioreactor metagenome]|uniref:Uncharacterized protein n=1 Tax=bioreactor metagenome TaxID=1076179 RepID=A0A644YS24_9ZZZZ